jgi:phenylpropionate dioxygenase-like ring-hydroxylating dioxygenase large terminal subunit
MESIDAREQTTAPTAPGQPAGVARTRDVFACFRPAGASPKTRLVQWLNQRLNNLVLDEDIDLVDNVQQGLQTRGYECGPLSRREDAVAWFADRIRQDLSNADPASTPAVASAS